MSYHKRIEKMCSAQNQLAEKLNEMAPRILEAGWRQFGGAKILNAGNSLSKKFRDLFPMENSPKFISYFHASDYTVWLKARNSVWDDDSHETAEASICLFRVSNSIMTEAEIFTPLRADWTAAEIESKKLEIRKLKSEISRIEGDTAPSLRQYI